jgi:hypothetical protein
MMREEGHGGIGWLILAAVSFVALIFLMAAFCARAEQAGHTHEGAVGRFYQSWMMPDNRNISCCHDEDCKPAQSRRLNGHWQARHSDADQWSDIPDLKIETERDSPDGQSHLCARRSWPGMTVFCFLPAPGG